MKNFNQKTKLQSFSTEKLQVMPENKLPNLQLPMTLTLTTLHKSENLKDQSKFLDLSIQSPPTKVSTVDSKLGSSRTKDQLSFHSMTELSDKCSVTQSPDSVCSTKRDQTFYSTPSPKVLMDITERN